MKKRLETKRNNKIESPGSGEEETLQVSAGRFRAIFEQAAVGVAQIETKTGQFVIINKRYCDIVGHTKEEMIKTTFMEITHPDDLQADLDNMQKMIDGKIRTFTMEKRYHRKDGSVVWVSLTVSPMWRTGEKADYHIAVVEDITARKQAEEKLRDLTANLEQQVEKRTAELTRLNEKLKSDIIKRNRTEESLELLKALIDQTNDAVFIVDSETGRIIDVNEEGCKSLGYEREEILNLSLEEIVASPGDFLVAEFEKLKAKGYINVEGEHRRKDSTVFPVEVNAKAVTFKEKCYMIAVARDITERKLIEYALKSSKELLQLLFDTASEHILAVKNDGTVMFLNKKTASFFGGEPKDYVGKHLRDFLPKEIADESVDNLALIVQSGVGESKESSYTIGGKSIYVHTTLHPIKNNRSETEMVLSVSNDITERKRTEKMLDEQKRALEQKNIALNEVLGQIEIEKRQIKDNIKANVENLLLPIIEKLSLDKGSEKYAFLLQNNLLELTSSFGAGLAEKKSKLTSREIHICNMVKNGLTSKEIAVLLNISPQTISKHRTHIRKKLGIVNEKLNLSSVLKTV